MNLIPVNNSNIVGGLAYSILSSSPYTSSFLNFTSNLVLDFTLGPNYAKIDMVDSAGSIMGFFIIENLTSGVKISSIGPNDGNNYTNGYISQLNFTDLFVNPNEEGPITFTSNITSELGDSINYIDSSIIINCEATTIENISGSKNAALPIMAACIVAPGIYTLTNVADLRDTSTMVILLEIIGSKVYRGVLPDSTGFDQLKDIIGLKRDSDPEIFCSII